MSYVASGIQNSEHGVHVNAHRFQIQSKSDRLMNMFLGCYFLTGLILAAFYDTWTVAIGVGSLALTAYYSAKLALPKSALYQYVLSAVYGIFMAQFIYQMHGLFEMHFVAFIGSAALITYQNWKLQLPLVLVVVIHHAVFGYLQYAGYSDVYFTKLEYMDLQTFIIHVALAAVIFFICGLWSYHFKKYSERHINQTYEMGRLQEAETQKEILLKANRELDKFVYSVSHDLRAPLTSMLGVVELSEDTEDKVMQKHLGMLKKSIGKLDRFILDILDYSRNSRMAIKQEEINFRELFDDIMDNLKYMDDKVNITTNVNSNMTFKSDRSRISVVMNNLVSNAIRYHNPAATKPFVNVNVETHDKGVSILIEDNGIGIDQENQEKVFDMFYRVSESSVGSGLGLYIVKETIDKLQGHMQLESKPGIGTKFSIYIPGNN
jgi:signal transduction histidine kinase